MPHHVYVKRMSASRKAAVGATVAALLIAVAAGWALTAGRQLREGFASLRLELSAAAAAASEASASLTASREAFVPYGSLPAAKARPREREEALREAAAALKASLEE